MLQICIWQSLAVKWNCEIASYKKSKGMGTEVPDVTGLD
jgi:hypothetical protein